MSYEQIMRCRYYPYCQIHIGLRRPRDYSPELIEGVKKAFANGMSIRRIERLFGMSDKYAKAIRDGFLVAGPDGKARWIGGTAKGKRLHYAKGQASSPVQVDLGQGS